MVPDTDLLVVLALSLVGAWIVLSKPRPVQREAWTLLRSLWPSWRFFEAISPVPTLSVRVVVAPGQFGAWRTASIPPRRPWYAFALNAEGNLYLAYGSVVERLVHELDGHAADRAPGLVSYALVRRIVEATLPADGRACAGYQFKLDDAETGEELFVSEVHVKPADDAPRAG